MKTAHRVRAAGLFAGLLVGALALMPARALATFPGSTGRIAFDDYMTQQLYAVNPDGTLGAFTVFTEGVGIGDGQKTDKAGNLFSSGGAGPGIIRITSPEGKLLGTINLPIYGGEPKKQICTTNEAFGGPDGKTLFIAGCDAVYTIQLKTPGIVPAYNVNK